MPQVAVNNGIINTFRFGVEWDLYQRKVTFDASLTSYAGSSGSGIFSIAGISFLLEDQQGVVLTSIDFSDASKFIVPTTTQEFEVDLSSLPIPFIFQTYKIQGAIKDSNGNVYYTAPIYKKICEPVNITESGYVPGIFQIISDCVNNVLTVKELTLFTYNNQDPLSKTKSGTLSYPTGTISAVSFTNTPFSNNVIYTGEYRINCTSVATYDLEDDVYVLVTYLTNNVFPITCANKIADLICCMVDLQRQYEANCNNAQGKYAQQKLNDVVVPFMLGLTKEINGQDASTEADLIKKTLNCDCGATSVRQNEFTPINPATTSIVLSGVGGTTVPSPTINGNTKTYQIASNVYQVVKGNTGDLAFTIDVDNSTTYLVKYKITFNYDVMAGYILTAISNNPQWITLLNSLIRVSGGVDLSGLDGKCVIDLSSINYFLQQNINVATKIETLVTATTDYDAPDNLYATSAASVQSWLNSLGVGTFVVTVAPSVGNVTTIGILSLNNNFDLSAIVFSSPDITIYFQKTNVTLVTVLQAIIDYLCALTALQVYLGNTITLWQIDYNGNATSQSFTSVQSQAAYNQGIAESIYNIVQRILTLTGITCAKISALFTDSPNISWSTNSRLFGTTGDACISWTDKQIALMVIRAISAYTDVKSEYCEIDCDTPATCPDVTDISLAMVGTNIGVYGLTWTATPLGSQTTSLYYKRTTDVNYTLATNALVILPNGNIQVNPPYIILNPVAGATYDVKIVNNCGGSGFVKQIIIPTGTVYSGTYRRENTLYAICGSGTVTLYTAAPFDVGVIVYTNVGLTIPLTGYSYISDSSGSIYTIDTSTGQVLADTGSTCNTGTASKVLLGNDTGTICAQAPSLVRYTNGAFVPGAVLYEDSSLTTPVTGYSYVVNVVNSHIYNLNSVTGIIGSDTGLTCGAYSSEFRRDNSEVTICAASVETLYSEDVFEPGVTLYTDAGLTTLATGYSYVADQYGVIYGLNPITAVVGAATGNAC